MFEKNKKFKKHPMITISFLYIQKKLSLVNLARLYDITISQIEDILNSNSLLEVKDRVTEENFNYLEEILIKEKLEAQIKRSTEEYVYKHGYPINFILMYTCSNCFQEFFWTMQYSDSKYVTNGDKMELHYKDPKSTFYIKHGIYCDECRNEIILFLELQKLTLNNRRKIIYLHKWIDGGYFWGLLPLFPIYEDGMNNDYSYLYERRANLSSNFNLSDDTSEDDIINAISRGNGDLFGY